MEGMLMLLIMMIITMVLTWALNGEQRKRAVSLLLCAAMMSSYIPAINVARADSIAKPVFVNEQVLVNGTKTAQIGAVTYSASGSAYTLDTSSARVRVKNGDSISFDGVISAPEDETISWVRVDVYDANTEEPYTVGAEYYRASGMKVKEFDLSSIPALTIGEAFGSKDYTLAEGGKYIVMFCVGDSNGNTFADMDADIEDDQGPAFLVDVKLSPSNCKHPHSDYKYVRHSSGEMRNANYGDALTHQVEPLYERYCGLCDSFLMNIWGQGTPEEHTFGSNGVCLACGYYAAPMMMSNGLQTAAIEGDITITEAKYIDEEGISVFWDCSNNACMYFRIEASIGGDIIFEETRKRNLTGSQNVLIPYDDLILGEECEIYIEGIAENSISAEAITEGDTVYVDIPEGEFLNITDPSNLELEFGAEEESQMIYFEASGRWTAECDDDWVTLSKTSGGSDVVAIEVTVDANDGDVGVERETRIYIALSSGSLEEEIYVYQEGREMTNYEKFQAAVDDLEIDYASGDSEDAVTADVGLPETGLYGVTISWESSNASIIDDEGTVVRPDEDTEVKLTATLSYYQYTEEKVFYLTVLAKEAVSDEVIQFISHINGDQVNVGDSVTVEWNSTYLYKYYWEIKTLNGEPAYTDEEEGTIIDEGNFQGRGSRTFTVPESASNKWIRVRVYSVNAMDALREYPSNLYLKVNESENVILEAEKTEIDAGETVTFTAQSNADSVTLYIEAYNEVAGEWYVAVTKEMTKNGSEFTYTHEFANAGSKRVYAKTVNGTTSNTIEITANALKETLEAPVGGTMTATAGEEVTISWGAAANATGYTAHLYEMVDGQLESIGDVTSLISGTSLKYTFTEAGEYHVGVIATAEGYNPSEQGAVIVTVEAATSVPDTQSPVIDPITSTIVSPITAGTEVTFSTTAADDVELAKIELFIDGELKKTEAVSGLSGTISYTTSALAIGEHTVMVVATDASGLTNDVSLTVTVQKAESGDCAHNNTTIVRTQEYVSLGAEQHKLVYTDWTHCLDCDTGVSNVQDEDLPEKHAWKDDACEKCKHACGHNFELVVNENGENVAVVGSGKWQRQDDDYHVCTEIKYQTKCATCGLMGESDYKPAGWTEKHDYKWVAGGVDRNDAQHRFYEDHICKLAACGDKKTVGEWENHQYVNGVCACGETEPKYKEDSNGSHSNNAWNGGTLQNSENKTYISENINRTDKTLTYLGEEYTVAYPVFQGKTDGNSDYLGEWNTVHEEVVSSKYTFNWGRFLGTYEVGLENPDPGTMGGPNWYGKSPTELATSSGYAGQSVPIKGATWFMFGISLAQSIVESIDGEYVMLTYKEDDGQKEVLIEAGNSSTPFERNSSNTWLSSYIISMGHSGFNGVTSKYGTRSQTFSGSREIADEIIREEFSMYELKDDYVYDLNLKYSAEWGQDSYYAFITLDKDGNWGYKIKVKEGDVYQLVGRGKDGQHIIDLKPDVSTLFIPMSEEDAEEMNRIMYWQQMGY